MRRNEISPRDLQIVELRRTGEYLTVIAKKLKVTPERIRQILMRYNKLYPHKAVSTQRLPYQRRVKYEREHNVSLQQRREQVAELRRSGLSFPEIGENLGITGAVASRDLGIYNTNAGKKDRVKLFVAKAKRECKLSPEAKKDIITARKRGTPLSVLAEKYSVTVGAISHVARLAGLNAPKCSKRTLSKEDLKLLFNDYSNGVPMKTIIEKYGVKERFVTSVCFKNGVQRVNAAKRIDAGTCRLPVEVQETIKAEYSNGVSVKAIAEKYGVNVQFVYTFCMKQGVKRKRDRVNGE